jgi:hypothetical protein
MPRITRKIQAGHFTPDQLHLLDALLAFDEVLGRSRIRSQQAQGVKDAQAVNPGKFLFEAVAEDAVDVLREVDQRPATLIITTLQCEGVMRGPGVNRFLTFCPRRDVLVVRLGMDRKLFGLFFVTPVV